MGMNIEVVGKTWYTVQLTDEDIKKVKQYLKDHEEELPYFKRGMEENFCWAVSCLASECEIELYYDGKYTESDFSTEEINWSEFEERTAEEILGEESR